MKLSEYLELRNSVVASGYGGDIEWAESVKAPADVMVFTCEYIFVVCNSGMKAQIAKAIFDRVMTALNQGHHPSTVFGHAGKCDGIWSVWCDRDDWFDRYGAAADKVSFLETMPWIGPITKWHLAKNFGVDAVKPDRHLVRVADWYAMTPTAMCEVLVRESGDRIGTVDYVIWRACNLGFIQSRGTLSAGGAMPGSSGADQVP